MCIKMSFGYLEVCMKNNLFLGDFPENSFLKACAHDLGLCRDIDSEVIDSINDNNNMYHILMSCVLGMLLCQTPYMQ